LEELSSDSLLEIVLLELLHEELDQIVLGEVIEAGRLLSLWGLLDHHGHWRGSLNDERRIHAGDVVIKHIIVVVGGRLVGLGLCEEALAELGLEGRLEVLDVAVRLGGLLCLLRLLDLLLLGWLGLLSRCCDFLQKLLSLLAGCNSSVGVLEEFVEGLQLYERLVVALERDKVADRTKEGAGEAKEDLDVHDVFGKLLGGESVCLGGGLG